MAVARGDEGSLPSSDAPATPRRRIVRKVASAPTSDAPLSRPESAAAPERVDRPASEPRVLEPRSERDAPERPSYADRDRADAYERSERPERAERPAERPVERSDRYERSERSERPERSDRYERSERPAERTYERSDRYERPVERPAERPAERPYERSDRYERPAYQDRGDRYARPDRYERTERPAYQERGDRYARPERRYDSGYQSQPVLISPINPNLPATKLDDLYRLPMPKLFQLAEKEGLSEHSGMSRGHLILAIVRRQIERGQPVKGTGTLEVLPDGYGFLRSAAHNYLASPEDIYVSPSQIRRVGLRTGLYVEGPIRLPVEGQDNFALMQVDSVNGHSPEDRVSPTTYDDLTPVHPHKRLNFETTADEIEMRVLDLVTPIGKGQRGLIVSPPRAGKTVLLQKMAQALLKNHPECYVFLLLIDERPEEVTEMTRAVAGPNCEVVASTFDEPSTEHVHVSEMALEKAKRLVETGKDVVVLLDSITRLARAHNSEIPPGGKLLSGGLDTGAMQKPKRFFGAARQAEGGGSLTILATALVDTGSRMDEVIFEEFKGTGNLELVLDRKLAEKRVWPAIDVSASGTRKEELLIHPDAADRIRNLRRKLSDLPSVEAMEWLVAQLKKTKSNAEFLLGPDLA